MDSAFTSLSGELSSDPSLVCVTRVALRIVAEGLDEVTVGTPDSAGLHPWPLLDSHFYPQHLQARNSLPRVMHEPDGDNAIPPGGVRHPWLLSPEEQTRLGTAVGVGGPGMPSSVDMVVLDEGRREVLFEGIANVLKSRVLDRWDSEVENTSSVRTAEPHGVNLKVDVEVVRALFDVANDGAKLSKVQRVSDSTLNSVGSEPH